MDKQFTKLSNLVNEDITIERVDAFQWKMWDAANSKMLTSENWQKDYQKRYPIVTDKGQLEVSQTQLAGMLEAVSNAGKSDIINCTFHVKSKGQTGKDIRYYINAVRTAPPEDDGNDEW